METKIKEVVEKYQCPGCVGGNDTSCYIKSSDTLACDKHYAGTTIFPRVGRIFLGLPQGFCRLGPDEDIKIWIYKHTNDWTFDKFNVAVWKHRTKEGHILVRTFMPRLNQGSIQIFIEGDFDKIKATEITDKDIEKMD